ncbi:hypothetical protein DPEC_G00305190 [Dallia pectoralis]|uniref:Uncharacterized protein n=1 Tax=Dallia pectoralis TaxID=75939 RepID=A0ACC2FDT2_DALPE|nr:hypothetical protein DPEC_G00305190 [Dallia pectoralis]
MEEVVQFCWLLATQMGPWRNTLGRFEWHWAKDWYVFAHQRQVGGQRFKGQDRIEEGGGYGIGREGGGKVWVGVELYTMIEHTLKPSRWQHAFKCEFVVRQFTIEKAPPTLPKQPDSGNRLVYVAVNQNLNKSTLFKERTISSVFGCNNSRNMSG